MSALEACLPGAAPGANCGSSVHLACVVAGRHRAHTTCHKRNRRLARPSVRCAFWRRPVDPIHGNREYTMQQRVCLRGFFPVRLSIAAVCVLGLPLAGVERQAPPYPPAIEQRIAQVERTLVPPMALKGDATTPTWRLADRMARHKVPGVSIAVINNGTIEWVRHYGVIEAGSRQPITDEQPLPPALAPHAATGHRADDTIEPGRWRTYPKLAAAATRQRGVVPSVAFRSPSPC